MTTNVKVSVHCSNDKVVVIESPDFPSPIFLSDGEEYEVHVFDSRKVAIYEELRSVLGPSQAEESSGNTVS
jgi:hypothetical protein